MATIQTQMEEDPCYYEVLGLNVDADIKDIRRLLARQYHPDRIKKETEQKIEDDPSVASTCSIDMDFSLISRAYEILSDATKREQYNMLMGLGSKDANIMELQRQDAMRANELMKLTFDIKRRREYKINGLVIDNAVYGAREVLESKNTELLDNMPHTINVTRALQCMTENSRIVVSEGESKHTAIAGFYDPCPSLDKILHVQYFFLGRLHSVQVDQDERLLIPLKAHCIEAPNRQRKRRRKKKNNKGKEAGIKGTTSNLFGAALFLLPIAVLVGIACTKKTLKCLRVGPSILCQISRRDNIEHQFETLI